MRALFITKPFFIEPLGIMSLIAAAKQAGFEADLVTTDENIDAKIKEFKPQVLCYSIMTGDQEFYDNLNKELWAKHGIYAIAGGPHCTFFPEFIKITSFQCICQGEGEKAFVKFLDGDWDEPLPYNFHTATSVGNTELMYTLNDDLDSLPFPDRACVFKYKHINEGPIKHFMASRGCPYNCTYCFNAAYSDLYSGQKRVRWRSVGNLIEEIRQVVTMSPTQFVYLQDDTFILNKKWLKEFADKYKREVGLPFHCHTRANLVNDEVVRLLSHAGCYSVHVAAEAGSERVRREVLNRHMSDEQIIGAVEKLKAANIRVMLQNMIGLPFTTLEDDLKTLELNIRCAPDYSWCSIFQPYPRTALGERCVKEGVYTGDFSDIGSSFFDTSPLNIPHKNEVANLQKLFAIAVENPDLYHNGVLLQWIRMPYEETREQFTLAYKEFRKEADRRLYGFSL